jgi:4a-hydroxytetrahydrobiopterin dehydratase
MTLADKNCVPCKGGVPPLPGDEVARLLAQLESGWQATHEGRRLRREWKLPDFRAALAAANRVGEMAEAQNHHPDLAIAWGKLVVEIWTHKIDGLTESDFVFAAKCDRLVKAT